MDVHVVDGAVVFAVAYFVFDRAAAVIDAVGDVVADEDGKCSEYAGAVHGVDVGLEVCQAHGARCPKQRVKHEEAVGGGLDIFPVKYVSGGFHKCKFNEKTDATGLHQAPRGCIAGQVPKLSV